MKELTNSEKASASRQIELLSDAFNTALNAGGYWLNATGKKYPKFYPQGVAVNPHNALLMALHSDKNGCKSNLFTLYNEAKARGASVRENEKGVPFLFYNWNKYVNRNNPEQIISRSDYLKLAAEEQKQFKGVHNREIRTLFNIDQTILPYVDRDGYESAILKDGSIHHRQVTANDERYLRIRFNDFLLKMRENLVPVRSNGSGKSYYDSSKDAVYVPIQRGFDHYHDYVQETLRQIISATGHQQRLAREGMVMKNGVAPSEDSVKREQLVVEIASGIKMLELGLPAKLSTDSMKMVEFWSRELKEDPNLLSAIEGDVNNSLEVIRRAEKGEKIEYATYRNAKETEQMRDQLPKHYTIANEIKSRPDSDNRIVVIVKDMGSKQADVILPQGASLEPDVEVKGMSKARIERELKLSGIENVRFYNPDGAFGYRPDDTYFANKEISEARLNNWALEYLSTLDATSAVKKANEVRFDQIQMLQDDKCRWTLYIKPEGKDGFSIYPDKADLNLFFTTLKQSMNNLGNIRSELANKYYALSETHPELKVDLFGSSAQDTDLNKIERIAIYKTKDGIFCAASINGEKVAPRSVTPQQWQRMWIAEDKNEYKRHLAATLYADILNIGASHEKSTNEKTAQEVENANQNENQSEEERRPQGIKM